MTDGAGQRNSAVPCAARTQEIISLALLAGTIVLYMAVLYACRKKDPKVSVEAIWICTYFSVVVAGCIWAAYRRKYGKGSGLAAVVLAVLLPFVLGMIAFVVGIACNWQGLRQAIPTPLSVVQVLVICAYAFAVTARLRCGAVLSAQTETECIERDEFVALARRVCQERGWVFLEPVQVSDQRDRYVILTNSAGRGCNARITVSKSSGEIIDATFTPR